MQLSAKKVQWVIIIGTTLCLGIILVNHFTSGSAATGSKNVLFINDQPEADVQFLADRIGLDPQFNVTYQNSSISNRLESIDHYDLVVLNDVVLTSAEITFLNNSLQNGANIIFLMGPQTTTNPTALIELGLVEGTNIVPNIEKKIITTQGANQTYGNKIKWSSCPEILNYTILDQINGGSEKSLYSKEIIINSEQLDTSDARTQDDALIIKYSINQGDLFLFNIWISNTSWNYNFQIWPVFNYVLFTLMSDSAELEIPTYGNWQYSPTPHLSSQITLGLLVIIVTVVVFAMFRYYKKQALIEKADLEKIAQDESEKKKDIDLNDKWEQIGPHRQISGFLFSLFMSLIIVLPQMVATTIIMPQFVQPFPQVSGWFSWTKNFFQAIWILFDVGTSLAMVKYFAQYRVKQPEKAVHYIQIFVWWQMFSGTVQIAVFAFAGSFIYPFLDVGHMSWIFIMHSLVQYPGWFLVFLYVFQSMQRTDNFALNQILYFVAFPVIGQILFVLIFRAWGAANPIYGEAFGAGVGLALGQYAAEWMTFFFGLYQFKRMGFHPRTVFAVGFSLDELYESLRYGIKLTLGAICPPLVWLLQMYLVSIWILNWSAEQGYFDLIWNFVIIVNLVGLFHQGTIGAISESKEHNKPKLTQLYISEGLKWGNYFTFFLISMLFAVGDKIILGAAGSNWARATIFIAPLLIFQLLGPYSWLGDAVFEGTGRTDLAAYAWVLEQVIRALCLVIFLGPLHLGMIGVVLAYIPSLLIKDIFVLVVISKKVIQIKYYWYLNFIAPAIAGLLNYIIIYYFGIFIDGLFGGIISAAILFLTGVFGFLYLFAFFVGFLGGWDDNLLEEFHRSVLMIHGIRPLVMALYKSTAFGCKISPFHNKNQMQIWKDAMDEADQLTKEKVALKM